LDKNINNQLVLIHFRPKKRDLQILIWDDQGWEEEG